MKHITLLLILIIFSSCRPIEKRGYAFELSDYELLKEGINDKNDVEEHMGSPSLINSASDSGDEFWIYYSEDIKKLLFFTPTILNRNIVAINFSENGKINEIINYSLNDENPITINKSYTKVKSPQRSWWSRIFSNIGQVKAN
jgi:outer membrane protein assembly factor BamE (lipoprotein component of BamABCDE complex)